MGIGNLLFPKKCILCGKVLQENRQGVCSRCARELPVVTEPKCLHCGKPLDSERVQYCNDCREKNSQLIRGVSLWEYTDRMKQVMAEYKYGGCEEDALFFSQEMVKYYGERIREWKIEAIVPVPLHWRKRWFRGYNQAESLALALGKQLACPVYSDIIRRIRYTEPQKELDHKQRFQNLKDAFAADRKGYAGRVSVSTVLLVDDIYTTGATLEACAGALRDLGIKKVYFICLCTGRDY